MLCEKVKALLEMSEYEKTNLRFIFKGNLNLKVSYFLFMTQFVFYFSKSRNKTNCFKTLGMKTFSLALILKKRLFL